MSMKIEGFESLSPDQQTHLLEVHRDHVAANGTDRKPGMQIEKTWLDERGTVCARLKNGEWYHYYADGTWG